MWSTTENILEPGNLKVCSSMAKVDGDDIAQGLDRFIFWVWVPTPNSSRRWTLSPDVDACR